MPEGTQIPKVTAPRPFEDNERVEINGTVYQYFDYYKRLQADGDEKPVIMCPKCFATTFKIGYGTGYECWAFCDCTHKMVVYDG